MKVIDCVNESINSHPSLYMADNYEESTFEVLHHYFIVLGNGIEWADTGDPKTGGYLTHPVHRESDDEWVRIKDKPYGEEKYELDSRPFFKEDLFYFGEIDQETSSEDFMARKLSEKIVFESELIELKKKYKVCEFSTDYVKGFHTHCILKTGRYLHDGDPYPNFSKRYSCFWEIEPNLIQEDWRLAGIDHLEYWREYFDDEERVKGYHYYKNPESLKKFVIEFYKNKPEKHPDWIQAVRDGYEFPEFDGDNFEEFASLRWKKELKKTKEFISETLERIGL